MNIKSKFGKLMSIVLCLCMVVTMMPVAVLAEEETVTLPYSNPKVVYDFEETQPKINSSWKTGEVMYWKQGDGEASGSYVTDDNGNTSLGIAFTSEMGNIRFPVTQVPENKTAISVDIDASLMTAPDLMFRFAFYNKALNGSQTYGNEMVIGEGMPVYLISENGEITVKYASTGTTTAGRWTYIPAGFKGTVLIPFTSFDTNIGTADYVSDIYCSDQGYSNILKIQPNKVDSGVNIYYDNIALWGDIVVPPYTNPVVVEDFTDYTNQIKSDWSGMFGTWGNMSFDNFSETDGVFTASYPAGDDLIAAFRIPFMNDTQKAVGFNVDASAVAEKFGIRNYFALYSAGGYIDIAPNTEVYIIPDKGDIYIETVANNSCFYLPAGFKGKVIVPFESFAQGTTDWAEVLASQEEKVQFQIRISGLSSNAVISYDDICYYNSSEIELEGTVFDKPYETDKKITDQINTIEAWVKVPETATAGVIVAKKYYRNNPSIDSILVGINDSGNPVYNLCDGDGNSIDFTVSPVDLRTDSWTHIAFIKDDTAKTVSCYINGSFAENIEIPEGFGGVTPYHVLTVGNKLTYQLESSYFGGEIAKLKLWNKALDTIELSASAYGDIIAAEGLIAGWTLSGDNAFDDVNEVNNLEVYDMYITEEDDVYADYSALPEGGYTFAVLPDTQIANYRYDSENINAFNEMYDWIIANKETQNIQFVMGLGDITDKDTIPEWERAKAGFNKLTNAGIPWSVVCGNHDFTNAGVGPADTTNFDKYFPVDEAKAYSWFGGSLESDSVENAYYYITVSGTKYLVLCLGCEPTATAIEWANQVVIKNSDCKVIVTTHEYLKNDAKFMTAEDMYTSRTTGEDLWNNLLSKHENIIMALCGHSMASDIQYREDYGVNGNKVISALIDAQGLDYFNPTYNMVALLKFSADGSKVTFNYYSPTRKCFLGSESQFTLDVEGTVTDTAYEKTEVIDVTNAGYNHQSLINDFENGPYSTSFGWNWTNPNHYYGNIESAGSNYGKLEIITNGDNATVGLETSILESDTTAIYLEFDATDCPAAIEFKPQYFTRSDNPEYGDIYFGADMPYMTVSRDGEISRSSSDSNGYITIEAGFDGAVILPVSSFSSFAGPKDEGITTTRDDVLYNYELNTSYEEGTSGYKHFNRRILRLTFRTASALEGEAIKIDNLSYLSDNADMLYGDANRDGAIDALDLTVLRKYVVNTETEINIVLADANKDGFVNLKDLVKIKKIIAGIAS